jgi:cysteine-rich repeat protein
MSIERLIRKSVLLIALLALPAVAQAVIVGTLTARFDDTLRGGGVVAEGASLSGRQDSVANASAAITIAGIPAGATVHRALLYWAISGGVDTTATINAVAVTGSLLSPVGQTCWGVNNSTFRADVTAQVTGNGVYTIGGLPSSTVATAADTDGAALVVTYQQLTSVLVRRVMIRDGGISTSGAGEIVIDTFTGIAPPISSTGRFHLIVGDGTNGANDGNVLFNSNVVGVNQFNGSDGSLWDVLSYNVSIPALLANATWSHNTVADCLLFETAIVDFWVALCGDGRRTGGEACDDGNTGINDGCSAQCAVESGWECVGEPSVCTLLPDQLFQNGFE